MPGTSEKQIKKLAAVLATSTSVTASPETDFQQRVSCIHYPVQLQGSKAGEIRALIDFDSKANVMIPAFAAKFGLSI